MGARKLSATRNISDVIRSDLAHLGFTNGSRVYFGKYGECTVFASVDPAKLEKPDPRQSSKTWEGEKYRPLLTSPFVVVIDDLGRAHYADLHEVSRV